MTSPLIQKLANEMFHDFEIAMSNAKTPEEEDFWMGKIDALEDHIAFLQTSSVEQLSLPTTA